MKKTIQLLSYLIIILVGTLSLNSCVKKEYDDVITANVDPANVTANSTIAQLVASAPGTGATQITTDVIISGTVIADDFSGNFYKEIIIADSTGGIAIMVDVSNFNTDYPVGRKVFIKCKGLYVANDGDDNYQIGIMSANIIGRIPSNLVAAYIVKGKWGVPLEPTVYALNAVPPTNTLVKYMDVQFQSIDVARPFSSANSYNRTINDCNLKKLIMYTSSFSTFASALVPAGNGSIVGVYKRYGGSGELVIRDLNDLTLNGLRCDSTGGALTLTGIQDIRSLFTGVTTRTPENSKIVGTVISDKSTSHLNGRNLYIEDSTGGIQIRFDANHSFPVGSKIQINTSDWELSEYQAVLQINNVPLQAASLVGSGTVTPRVTSIAQINTNYNAWEGTLVQIPNVTITGSGTYNGTNGSNTMNDGTGSITLYTPASASFLSDTYPTGTVTVTGILIEYNGTKEIIIRSPADVQ